MPFSLIKLLYVNANFVTYTLVQFLDSQKLVSFVIFF